MLKGNFVDALMFAWIVLQRFHEVNGAQDLACFECH